MHKSNRKLLILLSIIPVGCLIGLVAGAIVGWLVFPVEWVNTEISNLGPAETEDYILIVAAEYSTDADVAKARQRLMELDVANPNQYVAFVAEKQVQLGYGPNDPDTVNVVLLAEALNVSTAGMVAYISTPTPLPTLTFTPLPTATQTPTFTPVPTNTPTPVPTDTPDAPPTPEEEEVEQKAPTPVPDTPVPADPPTPEPPTETPVPEAPAVDFVVKQANIVTMAENGGCLGNHNIFIAVEDVDGNPLPGAIITDLPEYGWFRVNSADKYEQFFNYGAKMAEIDLQKGGTRLVVAEYPEGNPVTSEVAPMMSTNDWEIPIPWLIEAGYCPDEATCREKWNSGVAGVGLNNLCWGHYSFWLVFQATHPF